MAARNQEELTKRKASSGFEPIFSQQLRLSTAAIEQQVERFYLQFLVKPKKEGSLLPADTILTPRERAQLPSPQGERERRALGKASLLKKDYLKAQLYDIVEAYGEALRMTDGPKRIQKALDTQLALFVQETAPLLSQKMQRGLRRADSARTLVQSLCGLFIEKAGRLNGQASRCYLQAGWYRILQQAAPAGTLFRIYAEEGPNLCDRCRSYSEGLFTLAQLEEEERLPPFHPNCRCIVLPVYDAAPATDGDAPAAEEESPGDPSSPAAEESLQAWNWYTPLLRIPEDALQLFKELMKAQEERLLSGTLSGWLDWLTFGTVSAFWKGLQRNAEEMLEKPNLYTISNWLTLGMVERGKEALFPEEPLSLQHWLSAIGFAMAAYDIYQTGWQLTHNASLPQRPSWRQSERDIAKENPSHRTQVSFLQSKETPLGRKGSSRPDLYKKGRSTEVKNYTLSSPSSRRSLLWRLKNQYRKSLKNLPKNTKQKVLLDIREQLVPLSLQWEVYKKIRERTGRGMTVRFKRGNSALARCAAK
ncbi:MAG: hypothetical protein HFG26_06525 [Provencibacterium sp.]|nr:hypothetical protein [Provencibacterium sp.]